MYFIAAAINHRFYQKGTMDALSLNCNPEMIVATITGVPNKPGVLSYIYAQLTEAGIGVDLATGTSDGQHLGNISFAFAKIEIDASRAVLDRLCRTMGAKGYTYDGNAALLTVYESGAADKGWQERVFTALAAEGVNILMASLAINMLTVIAGKKQLPGPLDCLKELGISY